jgi:hypothetical protein
MKPQNLLLTFGALIGIAYLYKAAPSIGATKKEFKNLGAGHNAIKNILDKAQIRNSLQISFKNNSHYWIINGQSFRVSDHTKPKEMDPFNIYILNKTDFRSYTDFFNYLKKNFNLKDKTEQENKFKLKALKTLTRTEEGYYQTPSGAIFDNAENALNNIWVKYKNGLK